MNQNYNSSNLHIIKTNTEKSILYNVKNNIICKIPTEFASRILTYQNGIDDMDLEGILVKEFEDREEVIPTHTNWFQTGILNMLVINVTNQCNLRCSYCYANYGKFDQKNKNDKNIDKETIDDLFTFIKSNQIRRINRVMFFGGEPLIAYKEIAIICNKFKELFNDKKLEEIPKYGLVTNLTQCNPEIINLVNNNKIDITASIDGPAEIHNQQRYNSYNLIEKNYEMLKDNVVAIEATYTMNHVRREISIPKLRKILSDKFLIPVNYIDVVLVSGCKELEVDFNEYKDMLKDQEFNTEDGFIFSAFDKEKQSDLFCNAGCNRICISINGDIYPCQMYVNYSMAKLGNIKEWNIKTYEKNLEALPYRKRNKDECIDCWARKFCKLCPAQALKDSNIISELKCKNRLNRYDMLLQQCVFGGRSN